MCSTTSFLFSDQCIAPPPCSCRSTQIDCENRHLTDIPTFKWIGGMSTYHIDVYLNGNQLTTIPSCAFGCPRRFQATEIHMYLNDNEIDQIDTDAFEYIETNITKLDLQNNKLGHLPAALQNFRTLRELNILGNPIQGLDGNVMRVIGGTLTSFSCNGRWSVVTQFSHLKRLQSLALESIDGIDYYMHHYNIFDGFKTSFTRLDISDSYHGRMPYAICTLPNLTSWAYVNSPDSISYHKSDTATYLFSNWNSTCIKLHLTHLNLDNNNLTAFPVLSNYFPNLQYLSVSHNNIQLIESDTFENASRLTSLDLSNNSFFRIPSTINTLSNLAWLNMSENKIVSIEDADLVGLFKMKTLILDYNPLLYVTPQAFKNNPLQRISFRGTKLVRFPNALVALNPLYNLNYRLTVSFDQTAIECSCAETSVLKALSLSYITFNGKCYNPFPYNGRPIMDFISNQLHKCP